MDEALDELTLAGYVPLRAQGLALPCFITCPGANRWHVAICAIDGDHTAPISRFEPYEGDVIPLDDASHRLVAIGDPWHDVLVWNGRVHVGTPEIVLEQLGDDFEKLAETAPLTLLDLALAVDAPDIAERVTAACQHVQARVGSAAADHWQAELFIRQRAMLEARRLVARPGRPATARAIREIDVERDVGGVVVQVSSALAAELKERSAIDAYVARIDRLSQVAGVGLRLKGLADPPDITVAQEEPPPAAELEAEPPVARTDVLIILSGTRAKAIGRHLRPPEWRPDWDISDSAFELDRRWNRTRRKIEGRGLASRTALPRTQVLDERMALPKLDGIATVIWVADDEAVERDWGRSIPSELRSVMDRGLEPLCILAPALPQNSPSRVLARKDIDLELSPFHTLLDTSTARSPFYAGNPKRSIDRRIADVVMAAAALTVPNSPLGTYLSIDRPRYEPLLLSIASGSGRGMEIGAALASEVSAAGLGDDRKDAVAAEWFAWIERKELGVRARDQLGRARVGRHRPDFGFFAEEVVARGRRFTSVSRRRVATGEVPHRITEGLAFPELSAAFGNEPPRDRPLGWIIAAEAPDLKALRIAADRGWQICRYSDEETLADLFGDRRDGLIQLPREIRLPRLNRLGRNKGIAIRGIDPRDVIRLPLEVYEQWREAGGHRFDEAVRWYRSDLNVGDEYSGIAALPVALFREAEEAGDPAITRLRDISDVEIPHLEALAKRTADLRASWARPEGRTHRYMLDDGRLPIRFSLLDEREVAAQKFFTLDGDGSIIALLLSRLFGIWAAATLSRSPSWSSRFSVTRTFETFPIPNVFAVLRDGETGRASLHLAQRSGEIRKLVAALESEFLHHRVRFPGRRSSRRVPSEVGEIMTAVDRVLHQVVGLDEYADDLTVLEHLVALNRSA